MTARDLPAAREWRIPLHVDEALVAFVRRHGRHQGRVVQVSLTRSPDGEAFLTLNARGLEEFEARMWVERLRHDVADRFGESVDVAIESRHPSALRGLMD